MVMTSKNQSRAREAVRSLASHPKWSDYIALIEKRKASLYKRLLGECETNEVFKVKGQLQELEFWLTELERLALPSEYEDSESQPAIDQLA